MLSVSPEIRSRHDDWSSLLTGVAGVAGVAGGGADNDDDDDDN